MKKLILIIGLLFPATIFAQMPVSLMDSSQTPSQEVWEKAELKLLAALECRHTIDFNDPDIKVLTKSDEPNVIELDPPRNFQVFNMPVSNIYIYQDPIVGASYVSEVGAPILVAQKMAKLSPERATKIGYLGAQPGTRMSLTKIVCTIPGEEENDSDEYLQRIPK